MSDAFLTLAQAEGGLTCFLVPRWRPDGERNAIELQRLKDKLGDRSNASAEIEYRGAWAHRVGEPGRGVATIIEMINHTRLDCAVAAAGLMRQALSQALHHARHRRAFQRRLVDQPLMRNVLADLALETEAATALALRVARGFDASAEDTPARAFARLAVAVAKYWLNKRVTAVCAEALECLGGAGFIEESPMPRLYRQAPVNGIWEGSGNVICLDVLRAIGREPAAADSIRAELGLARGGDARLDRAIEALEARLGGTPGAEAGARGLVEAMALTLQGALLLRHAPAAVAEAFLASRLGGEGGRAFGALPAGLDFDAILARASGEPGRARGEARA
jgi:putative acyl-CoA dehydrogenase